MSTLVVSDSSAVPGPVWPDSKDSSKVWSDLNKDTSKAWPDSKVGTHGSLPLRAGHVASQIQKLNIQLNQQETARVVRNREFVTSISVESEGREEEVVEGERKECRGFRWLLSLVVGEHLATSPTLYLFFTIMAGDFLATMSLYIPYTHLPDMAISRGVEPSKAAFLISSAGISSTVGRVLAGLLCDQGLMHPLTITLVATLTATLQSFLLSR